jgi:hypothetical protein
VPSELAHEFIEYAGAEKAKDGTGGVVDRTIQSEVKLTGIIAGNRIRRAADGRR